MSHAWDRGGGGVGLSINVGSSKNASFVKFIAERPTKIDDSGVPNFRKPPYGIGMRNCERSEGST